MNPNYNQIITVFRKVGTAWSKSVFEQCFWKSGITVVQNDTEASQTTPTQYVFLWKRPEAIFRRLRGM